MDTPSSKRFFERAISGARFHPFWLEDAPVGPALDPLKGDVSAHLAIVGGGFTGLWASIQAKEQYPELDVILIEANQVAAGASGRAGGIISTSILHGLVNEARVFPDDVETLERLGKDNLDGFVATIERHGIDADLEWTGEINMAASPHDLPALREEFDLHRRYGHDVLLLEREQIQQQIKSPHFEAGMWSRQRSGIVHPGKLAAGLKRAALALGVRLYEGTAMRDMTEHGEGLLLRTDGGTIAARRVLLATNAWTAKAGKAKRRVMPMRDHVLATQPLTDEQLGRIGWRNRQGIYDRFGELNYMRLTRDNRIVFGGSMRYYFGGGVTPAEDRQPKTYLGLVEAFYTKFPNLRDVKIANLWGGPIDYSMRFSVFFERLHGGKAIYAGGYSGFGVAGSRFGAHIAVALLQGADLPELKLDMVRSLPPAIPPEPLRWIGIGITFRAVARQTHRWGWPRAWLWLMRRMGYPLGN